MEDEIKYTFLGKTYFKFKELTFFIRLKPSYLIIGTQKGGTTSLYNYLIRHPQIKPALHKEVHYFDLHFNKPMCWYLAHYPIEICQRFLNADKGQMRITGEATPYYLFHPFSPKRAAKCFPKMKLICMLRNPIDRAYSHFNHNKRKGRENRSFEEAVRVELEILHVETKKMLKDNLYYSPDHRHFSYVSRGIYIDQLKNWHQHFEKKQLLVIKSEDFFNNTAMTMNRIFHFLGVKKNTPLSYTVFNQQTYESTLNQNTRAKLNKFYKLHNERLYEYLGVDYGWK